MLKSIFWKIFLSFWLVMLFVVTVTTLLSLNIGSDWAKQVAGFNFWELPDMAQDAYDQNGIEGVRNLLEDQTNFPPGLTLYILDDEGNDILDRDTQLARPPWLKGRMSSKLLQIIPQIQLRTDEGAAYRVLMGRAEPKPLGVLGAPEIRGVVIPVALIVSALACLLLTQYFSRPLARMVEAARELAEGNLARRVAIGSRSDEIGMLGRQFDAMADKIQ
ncbi:MAG: HAMP domain-containing protein, partial [Pseudomonadota bacterium]